jgi:hypothetical protein
VADNVVHVRVSATIEPDLNQVLLWILDTCEAHGLPTSELNVEVCPKWVSETGDVDGEWIPKYEVSVSGTAAVRVQSLYDDVHR